MSCSSGSSRNNNRHRNHSRQDYRDKDSSGSKQDDANENVVHVKYLLPSTSTGSVIGKGGERIASLQKDTNTKMKMSKAGDYFPGTQERVCLVVGTIGSVLSVYEFLSDKIKESLAGDLVRSRQTKLVIPNATAGVIIGKGGATIEHIKQSTNASLTITAKSDMPERVMTIAGDDHARLKALEIVLEKILEDPHHDSVPSVNYAQEKMSPVCSASVVNDVQQYHDHGFGGKMNGLMSAGSTPNMSLQLSGLQRLAQLVMDAGGTNHFNVDSLVHCLQSLGFVDPHIREIVPSIMTLINYGLIAVESPSRPNVYSCTGSAHQQLFPASSNSYSVPQRDRRDNYSRNSTDMDYKRFKSDQQRTNKTKH